MSIERDIFCLFLIFGRVGLGFAFVVCLIGSLEVDPVHFCVDKIFKFFPAVWISKEECILLMRDCAENDKQDFVFGSNLDDFLG